MSSDTVTLDFDSEGNLTERGQTMSLTQCDAARRYINLLRRDAEVCRGSLNAQLSDPTKDHTKISKELTYQEYLISTHDRALGQLTEVKSRREEERSVALAKGTPLRGRPRKGAVPPSQLMAIPQAYTSSSSSSSSDVPTPAEVAPAGKPTKKTASKKTPKVASDEEVFGPATKGDKFRCQNQRYILTFKTHIPKDVIRELFGAKPFSAQRIEIAHETGDEVCPYHHTHIYVDFGKQHNVTKASHFDLFEDPEVVGAMIHGHIRPIKGKFDVPRVLHYLAKEDPDNVLLQDARFEEAQPAAQIWGCESKHEAFLACTNYNQVLATKMLWDNKPPEEPKALCELLYHWQLLAFDIISSPRKGSIQRGHVHWFYETIGHVGKSIFTGYCEDTRTAMMIKNPTGGSRDIGNNIAEALVSWGYINGFIFDIPRMAQDYKFYGLLEDCLDGRFTNTKYMGGNLNLQGTKNIVVVANFLPKIDNLSLDRWVIRRIIETPGTTMEDPNHFVATDPLSLAEVRRLEYIDHVDDLRSKARERLLERHIEEEVRASFRMPVMEHRFHGASTLPTQDTPL